jgi:hypothetical protein
MLMSGRAGSLIAQWANAKRHIRPRQSGAKQAATGNSMQRAGIMAFPFVSIVASLSALDSNLPILSINERHSVEKISGNFIK